LDISAANATMSSDLKIDDVVHFEAVFCKCPDVGTFEYIKIKYLFNFSSKATPASLLNFFPPVGKIHLKDGKSNVQMCRRRHIWANYPMSGNLF